MNRMKDSIILALLLLLTGAGLSVQARAMHQMGNQMGGQRMIQLIRRLETDVDKFSNTLDKALDRSRLDGSMREDDVNALIDAFEYETDQLRERAEDNEAVAADVEAVLIRGLRLETFMQRNRLDRRAQNDWVTVRRDLDGLARMFNVTWLWNVQNNTAMKSMPVRRIIQRVESQTDQFQNSLDGALDQSSLDGTGLENEINALVQNLEKEADGLRDRADNRPGGGIAAADIEAVLKRAMMIETFMMNYGHKLNARTRRDWAQVKANLNMLADAYNVAWVWTIRVAPTGS